MRRQVLAGLEQRLQAREDLRPAAVDLLVRTLAFGVPFDGFGTIISVILLGFGFLFLLLGVLGEYIGLIYEEVKQRPNFVVR